MIIVDNILVDESIGKEYFDCDLIKCKGACCTFPGDYGAPVLDEEVELIKQSYIHAKEYLSEKAINYIEQYGMVEGEKGNFTTVCIDKKDCVFVFYEGDIALCGIEKAYRDGKIAFMKPISCHLFPIRAGKFGGEYLYYEEFDVCKPAPPNGKKKNIRIFESVRNALIRAYGEDWYIKYTNELKGVQ